MAVLDKLKWQCLEEIYPDILEMDPDSGVGPKNILEQLKYIKLKKLPLKYKKCEFIPIFPLTDLQFSTYYHVNFV